MNYLKALGVFRLVSEQADPAARLAWTGGRAELLSELDRDGLTSFLLERYCPTPIVAPWNGGSGFYGGGAEPLDALANSTTDRLLLYRDTITRVRSFVPQNKPADDQKDSLLVRCRAELADEVVPWLDVCFALGERGPSYFPLLGTGGNDGRLDFTNNFMQRLADVVPFEDGAPSTSTSRLWLNAALFSDTLIELGKSAVGQFNPGGIGGPNGTQGRFEAASRVNPWDFVLTIEGAILFAGSVARSLGANSGVRSVFPFSVESVAVGYGTSAAGEETNDGSRAELWLPLWSRPAAYRDVAHLFAEGRAQFGRRQARNAVEFAVAVNLLGVSRGVESFARYGFLKRNGLAFLAAPLGRIDVTLRPKARLLEDPRLTEWVDRLHRACRDKEKTPARYQSAVHQLNRALFAFANRSDQGNDAKYLLEVLRALGRAERTLANGLSFCTDNYIQPLQGLNPRWLIDAVPAGWGGCEFRLAASLASIKAAPRTDVGSLRTHLEPVEQKGMRMTWSPASTSAVWSNRPVPDNFAAVLLRRLMESERSALKGCSLRARVFAPLGDVVAFLTGQTDDALLGDLVWALTGVDWAAGDFRKRRFRGQRAEVFHAPRLMPVPASFGLIRLTLTPLNLSTQRVETRRGTELRWQIVGDRDPAELTTTPSAEPFLQLARRDLAAAENLAGRRLWSDRIVAFGWANRQRRWRIHQSEFTLDPTRLLAACLFPLSSRTLTHLARQVLQPPVLTG
jgi:CRISPR-associated protein Csx17